MTVNRISSVFAGVFLFGMAAVGVAQQKPLLIETSTMQPSVVLGRPMLTWWDVKIRGNELLTGKFQFFIKTDEVLLATLETDELTLNGPQQRIRVLLPSVDPGFGLDRLNVDISFQGKKFSGHLSEQILRIPFSKQKVFVVLVGESKNSRSQIRREKTIECLKFENQIPLTKVQHAANQEIESVKTIVLSIAPTDFPAEAMAYCGYDLVALMGDEFRTLRKPQLEGLLAWIKAGGSAYLEPNGVLEQYHVDFLRSLVAEDEHGLIIQPNDTGRLTADTVPLDQSVVVVHCGLGHTAIHIEDLDHQEEFNAVVWQPIIAPLWKMRHTPVPAPDHSIPVNGPNGQLSTAPSPNSDPWGLKNMTYDRFGLSHDELLDRLMPDDVQMVPTWVLAIILFIFVVLIGPGEYFGLGWLRARSLTWLTFPVATIAVTALTVWLTTAYMSGAETRRGVVLCDVGPAGDIVRTNRFELLFVAATRRVFTEIHKGLFSTISLAANNVFSPFGNRAALAMANQRKLQAQTAANANPNQGPRGSTNRDDDPPLYFPVTPLQGRLPTKFTVGQDLLKWSPQLNRVFSIPGTQSTPEVDWSEFDINQSEADLILQHQVPSLLTIRARTRFGSKALLACFYRNDGWSYDRTEGWFSSHSNTAEHQGRLNYVKRINWRNGNLENRIFGEAEFFRWIYQASVAPPQKMFILTDHTTPKGGRMCDDVPVFDCSDPKSWLLVIVIPGKDDFTVYRKLMRIRD